MAITVKSVGHFFARIWTSIKDEEPKVAAALTKVEGTEGVVETVTAATPWAAVAEPAEKVAFAVLGELSAVLSAGGAAASAKLADAGLDVAVVTKVENLLASKPQIVAAAKAL